MKTYNRMRFDSFEMLLTAMINRLSQINNTSIQYNWSLYTIDSE